MKTVTVMLFGILWAAAVLAADDLVCVADALNIRTDSSSDARVTTIVKYGETVALTARDGESGWCRVRTTAGAEGFAFGQYLMRKDDFRLLEKAIVASKRNDTKTAAAELAVLVTSGAEAVWPAPAGDAALVTFGANRNIIIAAGQGVLGSFEVFGATATVIWSPCGKYVVFDSGTTPSRHLYCFSLADEIIIHECGARYQSYSFGAREPMLFWVGNRRVNEEELTSPEYKVLAARLREIGEYGGVTLPAVEAFDCRTRTAYVLLAPDPADIRVTDSGRVLSIGMKPNAGAPPELLALVEQTDARGPYEVVTDASQAP